MALEEILCNFVLCLEMHSALKLIDTTNAWEGPGDPKRTHARTIIYYMRFTTNKYIINKNINPAEKAAGCWVEVRNFT